MSAVLPSASLLLAGATALPQQSATAPAPQPASGAAGTPLTVQTSKGAVTLVVDPTPQDGHLSIRVIAANFGVLPAAFGPSSFTLSIDGKPLRLADAEGLTAGRNSRSSRDSALARAAAAPNIAGFGQRDTTQDDNPNDAVSGVPGEKFARGDRAGDTDEAHRLQAALLQPSEVPPHGHLGGATLTDRIRRNAGTLDIAIAFAGDVYRFAIRLAGR